MANEQNLKPITSSDMARALQEKSVAKRKENNQQKMIFKEEILKRLKTEDFGAIVDNLIKRAKDNDKSFEVLRDTMGQKPTEDISIETKLPIFNIEVTDNKDLEKEFSKYETNTETS